MPTWFIKTVVGAVITLLLQLGAGIWWASALTAKVDYIQSMVSKDVDNNSRDIDELEDEVKLLNLKIENIRTDVAVLRDRKGDP